MTLARRRLLTPALAVAALVVATAGLLVPSAAAETSSPAPAASSTQEPLDWEMSNMMRGDGGQELAASSEIVDIPANGDPVSIRVEGRAFDTNKGIYVAYCVLPEPGSGALPSPCGGGVDMTGEGGGSAWISSNPPRYGEGLATPFGKGGTFAVTVNASRYIAGPDGDIDCAEGPDAKCGIVTRADHTRTSDRTQDVFLPTYVTPEPADEGGVSGTVWVLGGLAIGLVLIAVLVVVAVRTIRKRNDAGPGAYNPETGEI